MEPYSDAFKNAVCLFICPYSHLSVLDSVFLSICPPIIWSSVYSSKHPSVSVFWQSACLSLHTHICPFVCPSICHSAHPSNCLFPCLYVCLTVCLSIYSIYPFFCPPVCMNMFRLKWHILGHVFNSRCGRACVGRSLHSWQKELNLKLKTRPKQLLGYLLLAFALTAVC
jgi:hypothetical protein